MTYDVHVSGRQNPMRFQRLGTALAYRRAILAGTGRDVWIRTS